jgi:hypothetical protein
VAARGYGGTCWLRIASTAGGAVAQESQAEGMRNGQRDGIGRIIIETNAARAPRWGGFNPRLLPGLEQVTGCVEAGHGMIIRAPVSRAGVPVE